MGDGGESGVMHLRLFIVCVLFVMVPMATNTLRALLCKDECCVLVLLLAVQMYVRGCDLVTGHSLCACLRVYKFLILRFSVVDDHHSVLSTGCLNIKKSSFSSFKYLADKSFLAIRNKIHIQEMHTLIFYVFFLLLAKPKQNVFRK